MLQESLTNVGSQVEDYLGILGDKLAVDITVIYKLNKDKSGSSINITRHWIKDPAKNKLLPKETIHLGDKKAFIDKINSPAPFIGGYRDFESDYSFTFGLKYKSYMISPIVLDDSTWGIILCLDLEQKRDWGWNDSILILDISKQIALAIDKGIEFEELLRKSELFNLLADNLSDISLNLDRNLNIIGIGGHLKSRGVLKHDLYKSKNFRDIFLFKSQAERDEFDRNCSIIATTRHEFKAQLNMFPGSKWVFVRGMPVPISSDSTEMFCDVSDITNAIEPLQEQADFFKLLSSNSNSIFIYWNSLREPEFVTKSVHSITGYTPQETIMILKNEMDDDVGLISKFDINLLNKALVRGQDPGQKDPERMELELSNRQGAPVHVSTTINSVHDSEGNVTGYIAEMRDVTENELISQMEKKLVETVNTPPSSPAYIFHLDSNGIVQYANQHLLKMLPAGALLGKDISEYLPETQKDTFFGEIISRRSTNDLSKIVLHSLKLERETKKMVTISAAIYKSGRPKGFLCVMKESNEIEGVLRGTYEENLAKTSSELIWMTDMQLKYIYVSPSVEHLLGVSPEEFMRITGDKNLTPKSHGLLGTAFEEGLRAAGNGGNSWKTNHEVTYTMKKGRMSGILTLSLIIENKKPKGFMGVVTFPARRSGKASRNKD